MSFIEFFSKNVGSQNRFEHNSRDIDVRIFYMTKHSKKEFFLSDKTSDVTIDYNYWELRDVVEDLLNGGSNIFLFNSFYAPNYKDPSNSAQEFLNNREKFIGKNIIECAQNYINRKKYMATQYKIDYPNKTVIPHKHLYYACADIKELISILNGNISYPLHLSEDILLLKENKLSIEEGLDLVNKIEDELVSLQINNEPDRLWINNFISEIYEKFHNRTLN